MSDSLIDNWIRKHAPLEELCEVGGWPDVKNLTFDVRSRSDTEWIVQLTFNEHIMEISDCNPTVYERCGQFAIDLDTDKQPRRMRFLLHL